MNSFKQVLLQMQVAGRGGLFSINDGIFDEKQNLFILYSFGGSTVVFGFCLFVVEKNVCTYSKSLSSVFKWNFLQKEKTKHGAYLCKCCCHSI